MYVYYTLQLYKYVDSFYTLHETHVLVLKNLGPIRKSLLTVVIYVFLKNITKRRC